MVNIAEAYEHEHEHGTASNGWQAGGQVVKESALMTLTNPVVTAIRFDLTAIFLAIMAVFFVTAIATAVLIQIRDRMGGPKA